MLLDEKIRKEVTPKRVYATLKLIASSKYKADEIKSLVQPEKLSSSLTEANMVLEYLKKVKFIQDNDDGHLVCNIDKKFLSSPESFRSFFASHVFADGENNLLYEFTSWYMSQDDSIFYNGKLENIVTNSEFKTIGKEFANAWRLWASFLGLGFLHESQFIHNPYVRIKDCINFNVDLNRNKRMSFRDFMDWLLIKCPELKKGVSGNNLSYSLSLALRTLHDNGVLQLALVQDASDVWHLSRLEIHPIAENVSEVIIRE